MHVYRRHPQTRRCSHTHSVIRMFTVTYAHVRTHAYTHTHTLHSNTYSVNQPLTPGLNGAPGSEAVNLPHADMYLWMAYTRSSCWADQRQMTSLNNSQCLFFSNGESAGHAPHLPRFPWGPESRFLFVFERWFPIKGIISLSCGLNMSDSTTASIKMPILTVYETSAWEVVFSIVFVCCSIW